MNPLLLASIEGGRDQYVHLYQHPGQPELLLAVRDRAGDTAALSLTRSGAEELYAALAGWLQR